GRSRRRSGDGIYLETEDGRRSPAPGGERDVDAGRSAALRRQGPARRVGPYRNTGCVAPPAGYPGAGSRPRRSNPPANVFMKTETVRHLTLMLSLLALGGCATTDDSRLDQESPLVVYTSVGSEPPAPAERLDAQSGNLRQATRVRR